MEKLKDEINSRDIKIKWAQNKIRSELETHKVRYLL
jgi:peptide subunit release factor 1 (eRF1)